MTLTPRTTAEEAARRRTENVVVVQVAAAFGVPLHLVAPVRRRLVTPQGPRPGRTRITAPFLDGYIYDATRLPR